MKILTILQCPARLEARPIPLHTTRLLVYITCFRLQECAHACAPNGATSGNMRQIKAVACSGVNSSIFY